MRRALALLSFALTVAFAAPGAATIVVKLDLPALVVRADRIFVGRVTRVHSHWSEDGRRIVTDTEFSVDKHVRGTAKKKIVVRRLGGTVGKIGMRVSGVCSFRVGQQALLFTERRAGHRYVVGMRQGVFRVARDASTGKAEVIRDLSGLQLARRTTSGRLSLVDKTTTDGANGRLTLDQLIERVRSVIKACADEPATCRKH